VFLYTNTVNKDIYNINNALDSIMCATELYNKIRLLTDAIHSLLRPICD